MTQNRDLAKRKSGLSATTQALLGKRLRNATKARQQGILRRAGQGPTTLSFAQQRLWFLDQFTPGQAIYTIATVLRLDGSLDIAALQQSLQTIVERHEVLRTSFPIINNQVQAVVAPELCLACPVHDLSPLPSEQQQVEAQRWITQAAREPFDLSHGPLIRTTLLSLREDEHLLLLNMHHITADGWSLEVFAQELKTLYAAFVYGNPSPLPELAIQYADYALWQRQWLHSEICSRQLAYWRDQLAGIPMVLPLSTDHVRPVVQSYQGSHVAFTLPRALSQQLQSLSQQEEVTLFMLLLSAFYVLLARYSGQEDIVVGTPIANRAQIETEPLIGCFTNTLALRTRFPGHLSFHSLLQRVRETCLQAYAHQDIPFEQIVEAIQPERSLSHHPLFQVFFTLQKVSAAALAMKGLRLQVLDVDTYSAKFDLNLILTETATEIHGHLEYNTDLFERGTIERLAGHWQKLLEHIVIDPECSVARLPLLTAMESQQMKDWNGTVADYSPQQCMHQLFELQAEALPNAIAVVVRDSSLSYSLLNSRANQLAHFLRKQGVGPDVLVGVCMERSLNMLIALLGVLKAGGAYVPLDPGYPEERLALTLEDAHISLLLTQQKLVAALSSFQTRVICPDTDWVCIEQEQDRNIQSETIGDNLAYVIYTSGSTGRPKGVQVTHRSVVNFLQSMRQQPGLERTDILLSVTTLSFDIAALELFLPLCVGACVVIHHDMTSDAKSLRRALDTSGATVLQATPSTWQLLLLSNWKNVTQLKMLCGGEAFPPELARKLLQFDAPLWNMYGPTETTIWSTTQHVTSVQDGTVSIGRPIANTQVYILDAYLQPVPSNVQGDLYIGGDGLARGYLNQPELTAERFIPDSFGATAGQRLYRTGDQARYRADGRLEFLGRSDTQVKVRGFRIELGEIEAVLAQHPLVQQCAVLVREDVPSHQQLVAYLTTTPQTQTNAQDLRDFLQARLPHYMLPAAFICMEKWPLTLNNKIDRKALPPPEAIRPALDGPLVIARTPIEEVISGIWTQVLGIERIGIYDNFFILGGHSLLATQIIARIREVFHVDLPIRLLFEQPTIVGLAQQLEQIRHSKRQTDFPVLRPVPRDNAQLPLSFAQERLWFIDRLLPGSSAYTIPVVARITGPLQLPALKQSFAAIIRRHEILRASFPMVDGNPIQIIAPDLAIPFTVIDLTEDKKHDNIERIENAIEENIHYPFDLSKGPLLRLTLLRISAQEYIMLVLLHHIVADGWSIDVLINDLSALYAAYVQGTPSPLSELALQYADYALWQRQWRQEHILEQHIAYWREQLAGIPTFLALPTDHPRPSIQTYRGSYLTFNVSAPLGKALHKLSQQEGVTLFMLLLAAFQVLLSRYSGQEDIVVGTPVANRSHIEMEALIGCFANTLILRTHTAGQLSFRELLRQVRETCLQAYTHQEVPFEQIVEAVQPERSLSHHPLFQIFFALQTTATTSYVLMEGVDLQALEVDSNTAKFDLSLVLMETGTELQGRLEYSTDLFERETIERLSDHWQTLLESIVTEPEQKLIMLPLLTEFERQQLLETWNDTQMEYPRELCTPQIFEAQVARTPDNIALVFKSEELTYAQLNQRANQLARYLRTLGAGAGSLIGIYIERSPEMIIAMLGIHKIGGAYLPLDLVYPQERLTFMLEDAQVRILLTREHLAKNISTSTAHVVCLDKDWIRITRENIENIDLAFAALNLAYIIYTSGSTGKPKGVMITQRNLINFLTAMDAYLGDDPTGTWLAVTSTSFDISALEIFWTLTRGYKMVLQSEVIEASAVARQRHIEEKKIDFSLFYFASDNGENASEKYRLLMEGAQFADQHGFSAIWTPERHFHEFGGLYPNPAIISAAIAATTQHLQIRAGSVVLPLHNPIRVAEEWAVVDNLSQGRVGISVASGWHASDFVLAPENYTRRKEIMIEGIETIRKLWRGESIAARSGAGNMVDIQILPHPIQAELPIWVTAAGNPETFRAAGELGANLLTHLLGQSVDELADKIALYHEAWQKHQHQGRGHVTLMLHTFIGESVASVREIVRAPFRNYLKSSLSLVKNLAQSLGQEIRAGDLSQEDIEPLLDLAFDYYFEQSGLFGTPDHCIAMVNSLKAAGVDEIGCLIDFGVETNTVLASLSYVDQLRLRSNEKVQAGQEDYTIASQIVKQQVTHLQCTPSLARILSAEPEIRQTLSGLRKLLLGGEPLPLALLKDLQTVITGHIHNMYGPTETTIWSATYDIGEVEHTIPIGYAIGNTQIYILDPAYQLLPVGIAGELFIGGDGVVRGYLHRSDLTAERFIPDPYGKVPGARLYRTGDLARYRSDGSLEFLGRVDFQVKLRGFRIELSEIETVLELHPAVRQAVVIVGGDQPDDQILIAYIVPSQEISGSMLQAFLRERLPEYMVPALFVLLETLPLTPNGKVDRQALPSPQRTYDETYAEPRTPVEEILVNIWADLLGVASVGIYDNFFAIGGHSLIATQLISRVRKTFQIELSLRSLFEVPNVAAFASKVADAMNTHSLIQVAPITAVTREPGMPIPLAFAQQRFWFIDQLASTHDTHSLYNQSTAVRLRGPLNCEILEQVLNEIVRRHDQLRTFFVAFDGEPRQVVSPTLTVVIPVRDLRTYAQQEQETEVKRLLRDEARRPFNLEQAPLFRTLLLQSGDQEYIFLLIMHHIITDEWSISIFAREIVQLYAAFIAHQPSPLPDLPIQYADFTNWQQQWFQSGNVEQHVDYWKQQLAELPPPLELPVDYPRPELQTYHGARQSFQLSPVVSDGLKELSLHEGVTLFMILLAAFQTLLYRYTGQEDIVVGTPIANRNQAETEDLLGLFMNLLVLRTELSGNPSFRQLLSRVREVTLNAYMHQELPFELLVQTLQPERDMSRSPLFQVIFMMHNVPVSELQMGDISLDALEFENGEAKYDITFSIAENGQGLSGYIEYNTDLFAATTISRMLNHWQALLHATIANPDQRVATLAMLPPEEIQQQNVVWNDTAIDYTAVAPVHRLIEVQAERTPAAPAVILDEDTLTYQQLNKRANQLARYLRAHGVKPEVMVGIYMERSIEMVVAILGILKAGGAYVPLDPTHPGERLSFILEEAQIGIVLSQQRLQKHITHSGIQTMCLDTDWELCSTASEENLPELACNSNIAYVIYTSGSTGKPKGVAIPHHGLTNYLQWSTQSYAIAQGQGTLVHSALTFDLTITSLFPPLLIGRTVTLLREEYGIEVLSTALKQNCAFSLIKITPAHLQLLSSQLTAQEVAGKALTLVIGGEALTEEHLSFWHTHAPDTRLINEYGPTETVVGCCVYEVPRDTLVPARIPIGRPIANTQLYILDTQLQNVPIGVTGQLYIAGNGLARGYLQHADLTAEQFIPHPFSAEPGQRLYRTGDAARYRADGTIEFLGRVDQQIKLRGFRIEPGEIEAALRQHEAVQDAIVLARAHGVGDKRLIAYLVARREPASGATELQKFLGEKLPSFMLPSAYVWLKEFPLTAHGKVDRGTLPEPESYQSGDNATFEPPQSETEQALAALWIDLLKLHRVSVHDNFFSLGGHSLLATQLVTRLRQELRVELPLRSIFDTPTLSELAGTISELQRQSIPLYAIPKTTEADTTQFLDELDELLDEEIEALMGGILTQEEEVE